MDQRQLLWPLSGEFFLTIFIFWSFNRKNNKFLTDISWCSKTASEYLDQVQKLIDTENVTTDMNSYTIFMNLLGKVLKRLVESDTKNQIMKIIGKFRNFGRILKYKLWTGISNINFDSVLKDEFSSNSESPSWMH